MPEKRRPNLAETDRESYYSQEEWLEEFLGNKSAIYNGSESDDSDNDENYHENIDAVVRRFHRNTPVLEFIFNKVAGSKACNLIKSRLQQRCFPMKFANSLKTSFSTEHLW